MFLVIGDKLMGAAGSKLEKALGDQFPEGERYFGFENFGNTCYCNSVLQVIVDRYNMCLFFIRFVFRIQLMICQALNICCKISVFTYLPILYELWTPLRNCCSGKLRQGKSPCSKLCFLLTCSTKLPRHASGKSMRIEH